MTEYNHHIAAQQAIERINNFVDKRIRLWNIFYLWKECGVVITETHNGAIATYNEEAKNELIKSGQINSPLDLFCVELELKIKTANRTPPHH